MTVRQWLESAERKLRDAGVPEPRLDAQLLLAHAMGADRTWVLTHPGDPVPSTPVLDQSLARRRGREPLAYILGHREFWGRRFRVGPGVLVPRPETECLVQAALEGLPKGLAARVLDFGTGSGCIAITLQLERPDCHVVAVDSSPAALEWARQNARDLGAQIELARAQSPSDLRPQRFDLIVTNPPYVAESEQLQPEVADWEPAEALFAGPTGLEVFEMLAVSAAEALCADGRLLTEIGYGQAEAVTARFSGRGWKPFLMRNDLSGIPRVLGFRAPSAEP